MVTEEQYSLISTEVTSHGSIIEKLDGNSPSFIFLHRDLLLTLQKIKKKWNPNSMNSVKITSEGHS